MTAVLTWDYCVLQAMCRDYYTLQFMDRSVDTSPIAPALAEFFDDVLDQSIAQLNFKVPVSPGNDSAIHCCSGPQAFTSEEASDGSNATLTGLNCRGTEGEGEMMGVAATQF